MLTGADALRPQRIAAQRPGPVHLDVAPVTP